MTPNGSVKDSMPTQHGYPNGNAGHPGLPTAEAMDLRHYVAVLLDYWWLLMLALLAGSAVGAYLWMRQADSPLFAARCRFEITADSLENVDGRRGGTRHALIAEEMERMSIMLRSPSLQREVRAKLRRDWQDRVDPDMMHPQVTINSVRGSDSMMDLSVQAGDGEYALAFLEQLLAEYDEYHRNWVAERQRRATSTLRDECDRLQIQLDEARSELLTFQEQANIRLTQAKAAFDDQFLAGLVQRENAVRMERTMLEGQFDVLKEADAATINDVLELNLESHRMTLGRLQTDAAEDQDQLDVGSAVFGNQQSWQSREETLAHLEAQYQSLLGTYKSAHPKMKELSQQIEQARNSLEISAAIGLQRLKARHRALKIQEQSFQNAASQWKSQSQLTSSQSAQYEELKATVDHLKHRYEQVYARMLDARAAHGDTVYRNMIEEPASGGRVLANAYRGLAMAIVLSLAAGIGLAFMLDYLDTSLQDIQAVEQRLGLAYLHGIPNWRRLLHRFNRKRDVIVINQHARNVATEAYRNLRGILEHAMGEDGSYALAITSAQAGEGKSMTAVNLAVAFSWTGKKVLLLDGDLRRGTLHKGLDIPNEIGLTEILGETESDWRKTIQTTSYPNLDAIATGAYRRDAPELLRPNRLKPLFNELRQVYDLIIVDTPPIGKVVEAEMFSRFCDGTVLITRFGKTRYTDVQHATRHLNGTNVLGFCVNAVEFGKQRYASSYAGDYYNPKAYEPSQRKDRPPPEMANAVEET